MSTFQDTEKWETNTVRLVVTAATDIVKPNSFAVCRARFASVRAHDGLDQASSTWTLGRTIANPFVFSFLKHHAPGRGDEEKIQKEGLFHDEGNHFCWLGTAGNKRMNDDLSRFDI
jgi:hypothetical protein